MKLYKTLKKGLRSERGNHKWQLNKWDKIKGKLSMCNNGFHCSKRIINAMDYVAPDIIAEVEVRGKSIKDDDKQCWEEMRITKIWKWTEKDSVAMAIYVAELVLPIYEKQYPNDNRIKNTIEAAKKVLEKDTKKNRDAARATEWAARATEWAASAEWAAWAARATEWAASAAKYEKILNKIEKWIHKRIEF
ncbi:hypothetical protein KKE60_08340 [Patescibacteria group bacterium]|nr:hypothetical protein [Patescibacteria group bacterium]